MNYEEIVKWLRSKKVETGSLLCLGCGYEHNCGIHGCAVMRAAADSMENLQTENAALRRHIDNLTDAQAVMVKEFDKKLEELHEVKSELNAYKSTFIEPDVMKERCSDVVAEAARIIRGIIKIGAIDHLRDLLQAEIEGRMVVLPCGTDVELERDGHTFKADHWNHTLTAFRYAPENKSGKQVALFSIEEAEAALAQEGGEG